MSGGFDLFLKCVLETLSAPIYWFTPQMLTIAKAELGPEPGAGNAIQVACMSGKNSHTGAITYASQGLHW